MSDLELKDPLFDVTAASDDVAVSPVSNDKMFLAECNNIPVWVHLGDRVCLPVNEDKKIV